MSVHVLIWRLDMPGLARCTVCGEEWRRPKGQRGVAELAAFEERHRHQARLFDIEAFEPGEAER